MLLGSNYLPKTINGLMTLRDYISPFVLFLIIHVYRFVKVGILIFV